MKRVVSLVAALALAVGAFAPAAFASDAGYGQTGLIPLEDLDQETFDAYLKKFYSQDYPTYGVLDLIRDTFQGGLSNASGVNDSVWSWALNLVDNAGDIGTEIGLWLQGVEIDPNTGKVIYPDDYLTDYAKNQLDSQLKSSGTISIGSGIWYNGPLVIYSSYGLANYLVSTSWGAPSLDDVYWTKTDEGLIACARYSATRVNFYYLLPNGNKSYSYIDFGTSYTGSLFSGVYLGSSGWNTYYIQGLSSQYPTKSAACADFFGYDITPAGSWNGSGYYSDHQDSFSINLPSLPSSNWGNLSKYYYTTYGDEIVDGDIDRYYYNIANNYAPYEVSYELPYWLINGSTSILDFNYNLELPTAELSSLPEDFHGGSNFWDSSFSMLAGFGSFIVLGLSFALVGLFFKD